jgi:hypothetical protein
VWVGVSFRELMVNSVITWPLMDIVLQNEVRCQPIRPSSGEAVTKLYKGLFLE